MEQAALITQWTTLSSDIASNIAALNTQLSKTTYVTGASATSADDAIYTAITATVQGWISANDYTNRHIIRWFDLVQHSKGESLITVDFSTVLAREIKEKPKKKDAAKDAPKDAPKAEKKAEQNTPQAPKGKPTTPEAIAAAKAAKEAKKAAKAKANAEKAAQDAQAAAAPPTPTMIDLRVGYIEKAIKHPDADSLYVSTIQMGDAEGPRTVCSGLVKHFALEEMQQRKVIVVANLKPVNMRGIKSCAMVLCAANPEGKVEFVNPPEGAEAGDKVYFEGYNGTPEKQLNPKKKIWEQVQPKFTSLDDFTVVYKDEDGDKKLITEKGICKCSTIANADIR
ncbi:Arc1 protein [Martiniozyma asiatica (nom. inval.)]|nr:Arc1 protein [Martiniozyma asiatica]